MLNEGSAYICPIFSQLYAKQPLRFANKITRPAVECDGKFTRPEIISLDRFLRNIFTDLKKK